VQDVQPAVRAGREPDDALQVRRLRGVGVQEVGRAPGLPQPLGHELPRLLVDVGDDHPRALTGERCSGGGADAGPSAGDDRDLAVEAHG
jgi:hypothetical protein